MRSRTGLAFAALVLGAGLALGGCGRGGPPTPPTPAATAAPARSTPVPTPVSAEARRGGELFRSYCISCHSVDGRGLKSLGIDLTASRFVAENSDPALEQFLRRGRQPEDPGNRTGRQMPGVAVLPEIGDPEVRALVAHLRGINRRG